jgi:protein phosphatase
VPNLAERITRFVDGRPEGRSPDLRLLHLEHGDRILLCTDGLSSYVPENQIAPVLSGNGLDEVAEHLIRLAIDDGGRDNVTVVVVDVRMGA